MSSAFAALAKTLATIALRPYIGSVVRDAYNERQPIRKRLQSEAREKEKSCGGLNVLPRMGQEVWVESAL